MDTRVDSETEMWHLEIVERHNNNNNNNNKQQCVEKSLGKITSDIIRAACQVMEVHIPHGRHPRSGKTMTVKVEPHDVLHIIHRGQFLLPQAL